MNVFGAPAVDGLGNAGGFKLADGASDRRRQLRRAPGSGGQLAAPEASRQPGLVGVSNNFRAGTPQLYVDVDRTKVRT